jgi:hypothetical protein
VSACEPFEHRSEVNLIEVAAVAVVDDIGWLVISEQRDSSPLEDRYELSQRMGESYGRAYATTQLARVALEMGDPARARRHALEALRAAWRLQNLYASSYALELWATAELRIENAEQAGTLLTLAERGYHLAGAGPWSTDAEPHAKLQADLQSALGERYRQLIAGVRNADLDEAIAELLRSEQPITASTD